MSSNKLWAGALTVLGPTTALLVAQPASAQPIIPISQARSIHTGGFVEACGFDDELDAADMSTGFELFDRRLLETVDCAEAHGSALAHQRSQIEDLSLSAHGGGLVETSADSPNTMLAIAESRFDVVFNLTEQSEFSLEGQLSGFAVGDTSVFWGASVMLIADPGSDSEAVVQFHLGGDGGDPGDSIILAESGVLEPGVFQLLALAAPAIDAPDDPVARATASYDITFTLAGEPPCRGDLDGDGHITLSDLAVLLSNFGAAGGASTEDGDLDGDGDVDLSDLAALLAEYGSSCA